MSVFFCFFFNSLCRDNVYSVPCTPYNQDGFLIPLATDFTFAARRQGTKRKGKAALGIQWSLNQMARSCRPAIAF